jgi:hypothetical protein
MVRKRRTTIRLCQEDGCKNAQTTSGFCRLHYLRNWRKIKGKQRKDAADKLNKYVDYMSKRFPGRVVEEIKKELRTRNIGQMGDDAFSGSEDPTELQNLFSDEDSKEEMDRLLQDLKVDRNY